MGSVEYTLLASVFYQRQQGGARKRFRAGDTITGLSPENVDRLLKIGAIAPKSKTTPTAPSPAEPEPDSGDDLPADLDDDGTPPPARPKSAQSVEVWRQYAIAVGFPAGEVADMTKKQLQEATK